MKTNRGELLKRLVEDSNIPIQTVVKKAGFKSTTSYYQHIKKEDLTLDILMRYGKAIKYDFSRDFPEIKSLEDTLVNEDPKTIEEAIRQMNVWKEKYYKMTEENIELIREIKNMNNKK